MENKPFGQTGLIVSRICFGTWSFGGEWGSVQVDRGKAAVRTALDLGIDLFDTTQTHGVGASEAMLGEALAEAIALGERAGLDRDAFLDAIGATAVLSPGQQSKLENARRDEYPVTFALRLMWKDFGLVQRLAHDLSVAMPTTAAAQQVCAVAQANAIEEDFSAVIRTMRELTEVPTRPLAAHV